VLTAVVGHNRKVQLGQAVHHSTTDTGNVDDRPDPVVLPGFVIDVPHGLGDVACRGHGVGLVVGAVHPDPASFSSHDHRLVLAESGDVGGDDRAASPFEGSLLCRLDPLGQDQRVIGEIRKLAEHFRLVDRAGDAPTDHQGCQWPAHEHSS